MISPINSSLINYSNLPADVLKIVFFKLPLNDLLKVNLTCRRWRGACQDPKIWAAFQKTFIPINLNHNFLRTRELVHTSILKKIIHIGDETLWALYENKDLISWNLATGMKNSLSPLPSNTQGASIIEGKLVVFTSDSVILESGDVIECSNLKKSQCAFWKHFFYFCSSEGIKRFNQLTKELTLLFEYQGDQLLFFQHFLLIRKGHTGTIYDLKNNCEYMSLYAIKFIKNKNELFCVKVGKSLYTIDLLNKKLEQRCPLPCLDWASSEVISLERNGASSTLNFKGKRFSFTEEIVGWKKVESYGSYIFFEGLGGVVRYNPFCRSFIYKCNNGGLERIQEFSNAKLVEGRFVRSDKNTILVHDFGQKPIYTESTIDKIVSFFKRFN
jgi:hypothetical protein